LYRISHLILSVSCYFKAFLFCTLAAYEDKCLLSFDLINNLSSSQLLPTSHHIPENGYQAQ
jgi:hypothetical protein